MNEDDDDSSSDENSKTYSIISTVSSRGRKPKRFSKFGDSEVDNKRLCDVLMTVVESSGKVINQFSVKDDWSNVARIYYDKTRVTKGDVSKLYNHYNRHISGNNISVLSGISKRESAEDVNQGSSTLLSSISVPQDLTRSERKWLYTVTELVKSATSGIVNSAIKESTFHLLHKRPNLSVPVIPPTQCEERREGHNIPWYAQNEYDSDTPDRKCVAADEQDGDFGHSDGILTNDEENIDRFSDKNETHTAENDQNNNLSDEDQPTAQREGNQGQSEENQCMQQCTTSRNLSNETSDVKAGLFERTGISHETAEALAGCALPKSKIITKKIGGMSYKMKVPEEWKKLPILQHKGYRSYGGNYIKLALSCVKMFNPYCSFKMGKNYIKKENSRKSKSGFFNGKGECKPPCPCKFDMILHSEHDGYLTIKFTGDVRHDITKPISRQIRGKDREKEKKKYLENTKINPADEYRNNLDTLPAKSFANGNRDGAGISKKTHQNIKAEAIRDVNSFDVLHKGLLDLQKKITDIDKRKALSEGATYRKIFGFIPTFIITHDELKIIVFHEKEIRLFHDLCAKDIVYLDATGGVLRKLAKFGTIYMYALGIRHPFGDTYPLPTGMYISSSQTTDSVRYFLMTLRESEKILYQGKLAQPRIVVTDNSHVLQNACLLEFNGESRLEYQNRTYRIVTGTATDRDLKLTLLVSCHTHIIGQVKRSLSKYDSSKKHFALRVIGRMINCYCLQDLTQMVVNVQAVMTSKYVEGPVEEAVAYLNELINDWSVVINKLIDEECDNSDDNDDNEPAGNECPTKSPWHLHWNNVLASTENETAEVQADDANVEKEEVKVEDDLEVDNETVDNRKSINKYYMPKFFAYFRKNMLNDVDIWTKLCFADLSRYGPRYCDFLKEPSSCGRNYRIKNTSNACVENIFKFIKNDKSAIKTPLIPFIELLSKKVDTLSKEFIDCILRNLGKGKEKDFTKRNIKNYEKWQNKKTTMSDSEEDNKVYSPEKEIWFEKKDQVKKRNSEHSSYLAEPAKKIKFNPVKSTMRLNKKTALTAEEKKKQIKTIACCDEGSSLNDTFLCDLCEKRFHDVCTQYNFELAALNQYACKSCVIANFGGLVNHLHYSLRWNYTEESILSSLEHFSKMPLQRVKALRTHKFLPEVYPVGKLQVRSKIGVENEWNNCWLSSLLHCLFGTNIYDVVTSAVFDSETSLLFRSFSLFISGLQVDKDAPTMLSNLSTLCSVDLFANKCEDPSEVFEKFVAAIKAECMFSSNATTISRCGECRDVHGGVKCIGVSIEVNLPGYLNSSPSIENIIWNTFVARHIDPSDGDWCPKCREIVGATTYTFLTNCPVVLPLKVNRTDFDTRRLNVGAVTPSRVLNLHALCPMFTDTEHSTYTLVATINNEGGFSVRSNHFTAHLFDHVTNEVMKFDDESVTSLDAVETLLSDEFRESVYMMFYIRNDSLVTKKTSVEPRFDLPVGRRYKVEDTIFRERDDENFRIYLSILGNNKLTGDAVSAFIAQQSDLSKLKVLSGSTNLLASVKDGFLSKEYHHFIEANIHLYDLIVIPYHHKSEGGHFSLLVVYPLKTSILLLDSSDTSSIDPFLSVIHLLRQSAKEHETNFVVDEWSYIKPRVPQQSDDTSCGVWCCINAFKIMHEQDFPVMDTDLPFVRYWIAEKVIGYKSKKVYRNEKSSGDVSLPLRCTINVETSLPGQSDHGSIYVQIFSYRRTQNIPIPTRKSAQESRTRLAVLIDANQVERKDEVKRKRKPISRKHKKFTMKKIKEETEDYEEQKIDKKGNNMDGKEQKMNGKEETIDKKGKEMNTTDYQDAVSEEDEYTKRLTHVRKCKTKTVELIPFREFDRNTQTVRSNPVKFLDDMMKFINKNSYFPGGDGPIKLGIDRDAGTAEITDGNHRLTCAANCPSSAPEFVKVSYTFGRYASGKKLPKCPSDWPTFMCGCNLGFTTSVV